MVWTTGSPKNCVEYHPSLLCTILLIAGLLAPISGADAAPDTDSSERLPLGTEDLYFGELPIVLSATRLSQPVSEAPVAVTVIDRETIEASGARELADIFRLVPGFIVGSRDGSQRIVGYHGMLDAFNRRMQVLIDGRSVYTPTFGGVLWSDLSVAIEDIERIEVVRGPNAATYGPNSFQGVISITTRHASGDVGSYFTLNTGTNGIADAYVRNGGKAGELDYRVSMRASADSGFDNLHDDKQLKALNFRGDYQATSKDSVEFHAGVSDGHQQTEDSNFPREKGVSSYNLQALWRHVVNIGNEFRLQLYHNKFSTDDKYFDSTDLGPLTFSGTVDLDRTSRRTDLEYQHLFSPSPDLDLVLGVEVRRDEVDSAGLFGGSESNSNDLFRVFGSADYELFTNTNLSFGVMVEENDISDRSTSPRLAINHEVATGHTLRASVSRATRTPSLFESMVSWVIVGDVTPSPPFPSPAALFLYQAPDEINEEKIEAVDIGYFFNLPSMDLTGDIRLYREEYKDLIVDDRFPFGSLPATFLGYPTLNVLAGEDVPSIGNNIDVTLRGLELQIDWRLTNKDRLLLGYAFVDSDASDPSHDIANSVPEEILNLLWTHRFTRDFRSAVAYYSVDEFEYLGTADGNRIEEQHRLDLKFSQRFKAAGNRGEIALVIQSALGAYEDYEPVNLFKRRAYISLAMEF